MEIKQYQTIINKTAVYPQKVNNFGKLYTYLGLIGEHDEMWKAYANVIYGKNSNHITHKKALSKEIGDVLWYMTAMCNEFNLDISTYIDIIKINTAHQYYSNSEEIYDLTKNYKFNSLAESFKKYYRDGKKIPTDDIDLLLFDMANQLGMICVDIQFNIEDIMQQNYEKLIKRRETNTLHGDGDNREEVSNA